MYYNLTPTLSSRIHVSQTHARKYANAHLSRKLLRSPVAPWGRSPAAGYVLPDSPQTGVEFDFPSSRTGRVHFRDASFESDFSSLLVYLMGGNGHTASWSSCVSSTPAGRRLTTSGAYWVLSVASSGCCLSQSCVYSININHFCCTFFSNSLLPFNFVRGFSLTDILHQMGSIFSFVISP